MRFAVYTLQLAFLVFFLAGALPAEQWSRFRGPNGSGVSASTGLPSAFGPAENMAWQTAVPFARSSPVLTADAIFLTAIADDSFVTLALDRASGAVRWRHQIERARAEDLYMGTDSATPSPVTDGSSVYVFFQESGLIAYSVTGEERWRVPLGPFRNFYGIAASPILVDDAIVLVCDQSRGSFLLAVDKATGKELWRRKRVSRLESYTTPVVHRASERPPLILVAGDRWVDAYDATTGEVVWALPGLGVGPVSSPVVAGDLLFVNAPDQAAEPPPEFAELVGQYDKDDDRHLSKAEVDGTWIVDHFGFLDLDADGRISADDWNTIMGSIESDGWGLFGIRLPTPGHQAEILWNSRESVAYIPTNIVYDGILYMVKDGIVTAFDPVSGELLKRGRLTKGSPKVYASPVAADGKIYIGTLEGEVAVLQAGRDWQVLALNDLGEEIYASPAIVDGHLYVRTRQSLFDFALSEQHPSVSAD